MLRGQLLDREDLIAIGARVSLVPSGPWRWEADDEGGSARVCAGGVQLHVDGSPQQAVAVARFVAFARGDIPALLGHISALEEQVATLRQQIAADRQSADRDRGVQHVLVSELRTRSESRLQRVHLILAALAGALGGMVARLLVY